MKYDLTNKRSYELANPYGTIAFVQSDNTVTLLLSEEDHMAVRGSLGYADSLLHGRCTFIVDILRNNKYVFDKHLVDVLKLTEDLAAKKTTTDAHDHVRHVIECAREIVYDGLPLVSKLRDRTTKDPAICSRPLKHNVQTDTGVQSRYAWELPRKMLSFFEAIIVAPFCKLLDGDVGSILPIVFYESRFESYNAAELMPIFHGLTNYGKLESPASCQARFNIDRIDCEVKTYIENKTRGLCQAKCEVDELDNPVL